MTGGLIQLAAYGIQDLYLTGDPQITFFKIVYRRHTNFSVESIIQNFSSNADFGDTAVCTVSKIGDLIHKIFLFVEIPPLVQFININKGEKNNIKKMAWVNNIGYALIQEIAIEIGGKLIDKQYGEWLFIWSQVSNKHPKALDKMIGNIPELYHFSNKKSSYRLYIPLEFWFCKNIGLSLPLIALTSDINIIVKFRKLEECIRIGPTNSIDILEDVVPFKCGDFIEQTINGHTIYGYVIEYDYLHKKLYYIKIQNPNTPRKTFESLQTDKTNFQFNDETVILFDKINLLDFEPYRIYNSITRTYCTPKPNSRELIEDVSLSYKPKFVKSFLYIDYIYLDHEERNKIMGSDQEYLIEQLQFNQEINIKSPNVKQKLTLNYPCKAHYWIIQLDSIVGPRTINDLYNYTTSPISHMKNNKTFYYGKNFIRQANLQINDLPRFEERSFEYFNYIEPFQHHTRGPQIGINVYSVAIYPEEYQPSSAINMSKIENINMRMLLDNSVNPENTVNIRSYTINYNILRIGLDTAELAFT